MIIEQVKVALIHIFLNLSQSLKFIVKVMHSLSSFSLLFELLILLKSVLSEAEIIGYSLSSFAREHRSPLTARYTKVGFN